MSKRVRKLTTASLKQMIKQEAKNLKLETSDPIVAGIDDIEKVDAEEVDADALAGSLEQDIDYIKALKIHERKLMSRLKRIKEAKTFLSKRITKRI